MKIEELIKEFEKAESKHLHIGGEVTQELRDTTGKLETHVHNLRAGLLKTQHSRFVTDITTELLYFTSWAALRNYVGKVGVFNMPKRNWPT